MSRRIRLLLVPLVAVTLLAGPTAAVRAADGAAVLTPGPTIGGPLHAEIYPSGLDVAPGGDVVMADTGNNRVVRYAPDGTTVWSVGTAGADTGEFDNPRDIGIDDDGTIYVADTRNSRVVKLASDGTWLGATSGPAPGFSFPLGVSARDGSVYVSDTGRARVVVLDTALTPVSTIVANGTCANINDLRDAQADASGNVYVAGYKTNQVLVFAPDGSCQRVWGSTGTGPGQFRTPYGVDVALDPMSGLERVYVADALNNRVQVFTPTGSLVGSFGGFGEPDAPGTLTTLRRVAVARDGTGDVWVADLWGTRAQRWTPSGATWSYAQTIGAPTPDPTSGAVFHEARGMAFTPAGDLWVADTVHHGFQRFSDGELVETCGNRAAEGTALGQFNWPRGIAVDPATGDLWVADTKQHQLQVLSAGCEGIGFVKNRPAGTDERSFNWPYDVAIRPSDRYAFVVDTQNHRIKAYDVANAVFGTDNLGPLPAFVWGRRGAGATNFRWPSGVAVGPDGHVFVADRGNNRVQELGFDPVGGFSFVRSWTAGGTLQEPEGVAVDAEGRVLVADSLDDELVVIGTDGAVEASVSGLHHPSAVEVAPDGTILVADTYADLVRTYTLQAGAVDLDPPTGVVTSPAAGSRVTAPLVLTGTATDDTGVATVRIGLRQSATGLWWNGDTWQVAATKVAATLGTPDGRSTTWSVPVPASTTPGGYGFSTDVVDVAGRSAVAGDGKPPWHRFDVVSSTSDTTAPVLSGTTPARGAVVVGPEVTVAGLLDDDRSGASVEVALRDRTSLAWLQPDGTWGAAFAWSDAVLVSPGATSTAWSFVADLPPGAYGYQLRGRDAAGNATTQSFRPFSVS